MVRMTRDKVCHIPGAQVKKHHFIQDTSCWNLILEKIQLYEL